MKSLQLPILTYGYLAWCNKSAQQLHELQKLLTTALRLYIILSIFKDANTVNPSPRCHKTCNHEQRPCTVICQRSKSPYSQHSVCTGSMLLHNVSVSCLLLSLSCFTVFFRTFLFSHFTRYSVITEIIWLDAYCFK